VADVDIADHIFSNPDELDLNLKGFWISDREHVSLTLKVSFLSSTTKASISFDVVQEQIPAVNFVHKYESVFSFKLSPETVEFCDHSDLDHGPVRRFWRISMQLRRPVTSRVMSQTSSSSHLRDLSRYQEDQPVYREDVMYGI
jgi:hypothetical protein